MMCGGRGWRGTQGLPGPVLCSPMQPVVPSQGGEVPEDAKAEDAGQDCVTGVGGCPLVLTTHLGGVTESPAHPTLSPAHHAEHKAPQTSVREEGPRPWAARWASARLLRGCGGPRAFWLINRDDSTPHPGRRGD